MLLSTISVHAQLEYPPDYLDDSPTVFYENKGQIIDDMNNVRNDVKYYTTALSPTEVSGQANIYLFDDAKMSFVQTNVGNDTIPVKSNFFKAYSNSTNSSLLIIFNNQKIII